jgi:hypothetical protein
MEKIARLISVAAVAMALIIAFSGVASASFFLRDQGFDCKSSSSINLLNTGNVKYNGIMIGLGRDTDLKWNGLGSLPLIPIRYDNLRNVIVEEELPTYPLCSRLEYTEKSTASGKFEFHKVMEYTSVITPP